MLYSLRTKLSVSYVVLTLIGVVLISVLTNIFLERHFREYIIRSQEQKNMEIVNLVAQQYGDRGKWESGMVENIGIYALEQGLIIKVRDFSGGTVWDATIHNNGLCQQMMTHMSENMIKRYPHMKGGYVESKYPVIYGMNQVGLVEIGYYGPFYLNDADLAFINAINRVLLGVGAFSLVLALFLGNLMAKRLSTPISRAVNTAHMISKGYYDDRIKEGSNTTEIKQLTSTINNLAETLEKQEELRKRLTADLAHELRTPVATLQSHMEAMIDGIWKPDVERLESCHEEIMRIGRMVGDLEKLARFESGNLILNKSGFDVMELAGHIIKNFEPEFNNKGVFIFLAGEELFITADKDKISQVIVNLISNALKFTDSGDRVEVIVRRGADSAQIVIRDTGKGIPAEDIPYIFERFYRADKSRNRLTGGSGIGLTIAKTLIEAHNGKIYVSSELNRGTEFTVDLPLGQG